MSQNIVTFCIPILNQYGPHIWDRYFEVDRPAGDLPPRLFPLQFFSPGSDVSAAIYNRSIPGLSDLHHLQLVDTRIHSTFIMDLDMSGATTIVNP